MTAVSLRWGGLANAGPPLSESTPRTPAAAVSAPPLLPRIAAGDSNAVEECLDRYGGLVWSLARRYCGAAADAEDAVQEVFLALWKSADRFDPRIASEPTFVTMICRRRLIDMLRRRQSQGITAASDHVDEIAASEAPPAIELTEEVERIRAYMDQLSAEQRRVLDLAICEGLSQSSIAEITGWPIGTVKSHARRGMQRLRKLVGVDPSMEGAT